MPQFLGQEMCVQVMHGGRLHVARLPLQVQDVHADVHTHSIKGSSTAPGFELHMRHNTFTTGNATSTAELLAWGDLVTDTADQPTVALLHRELDWFGLVPIAGVHKWKVADRTFAVSAVLPESGMPCTLVLYSCYFSFCQNNWRLLVGLTLCAPCKMVVL